MSKHEIRKIGVYDKVQSDSKAKIDAAALSEEARNNYQRVSKAILDNGWENENFPKDSDIDYYTLKEVIGDEIAGLGTLLKNMKGEGLLDFNSKILLQDDTIITLIDDYYQDFNSTMVTYDRITAEVEYKGTSHERANY
mmetsp:Transcript_20767/g.32409  ORF Transcript_20767/g.32409 Transcript_20767/m.32409 type:complete len:139 (-) Transcript_20767:69-485(-)|eukprot:CAMPEP_0201521544 /NCGR_PEP_ID=MMETSP0161_2-20130828/14761_1 /ASSEMBLY_ACC=CAM_ASM_000251 /TAXON_ID=180227 /ORGANISM="Neoparamoeba aestuarina, Strain SoJaBio B1-5/56/2" /LENGTH=138 /DNA_ID=CAMNT_0047920197 /DNA_START=85 /DNA_END=501 /DNA_ORIENTATION=-